MKYKKLVFICIYLRKKKQITKKDIQHFEVKKISDGKFTNQCSPTLTLLAP